MYFLQDIPFHMEDVLLELAQEGESLCITKTAWTRITPEEFIGTGADGNFTAVYRVVGTCETQIEEEQR